MSANREFPAPFAPACIESLEDRTLCSATEFGYWPKYVGMDKILAEFPRLNGGGNNVAVIDSGVDTLHPGLGGRYYWGIASPRVMTVPNFADPTSTPQRIVQTPESGHGTGVAGTLVGIPFEYEGYKYQGILQNSLVYNFQYDQDNGQESIRQALAWILANHKQYKITAVNLTDFEGTVDETPAYATEIKALWDAGVFVATPVANTWSDPATFHEPITLPGKSPYIFGIGGMFEDGSISTLTQRGEGLDLLAPANHVTLLWSVPETGERYYRGRGTGNSWGTPYVVGTAMLMQQIDPTITPAQIMQILQASGAKVTDPDGTGTYSSLDMYAAIKMTYRVRDDVFSQGVRPNSTLAQAAPISLKRSGGGVANMKLLLGTQDWYSFTFTGTANVSLAALLATPGQPASFTLFNSKGKAIAQIGAQGLNIRLWTGQYFIRAASTQSLTGPYALTIRLNA